VGDFETNCLGTVVLMNALRDSPGCRQFVLASSGAVYGEPDRVPIREDAPLRPISPYGASKLAAETEALIYHKVYGLPVVIARLFNVYGPRMARFVVLDFLSKLHRDPSALEILGSGRQARDFNYVSDAVAALLVMAERAPAGEVYNVASGASCSVTELAEKLIAVLTLHPRPRLSYTGASWAGDAQNWVVGVDRLRDLGYTARTHLTEGLRSVADWFAAELRTDPSGRALTYKAF
jgi:UDP-glucose 4-epimerase